MGEMQSIGEYVARIRERGVEVHDIGHGHYYHFITFDGTHEGAATFHAAPDGAICGCSLWWGEKWAGPTKWALGSLEPLTVSPSLLCLQCGDHGFIRDGKWIPA